VVGGPRGEEIFFADGPSLFASSLKLFGKSY
jgi:hypothetical protein